MTEIISWPGAAAAGLVLVHLFAGKLRLAPEPPRSVWLSAAGGLSVAYVFVHLLPELHARQREVTRGAESPATWLEHHVYIVALLGLVVFYGLERLARTSRASEGDDTTTTGVFWLHVGSFALYNLLIGYLLVHREDDDLAGLATFFVAMALHFFVTDHGLHEHHKKSYEHAGRYVVSAAILAGFLIGVSSELSALAVTTLFAFLAGSVMLNVLKEELPEERESRFAAFVAGAAVYTAVLLLL